MKSILKIVVATMIALFLISGCADTTSGVWASSSGDTRIDNHNLAQDVQMEQLQSRHIGGLLQGVALLSSKASADQHLQYKFTWFDALGIAVDEEGSAWKSVTLHGKQSLQVNALAPNRHATNFEVYLREAHSY